LVKAIWRPYIHVRDAARAIQLVLNSPAAKVAARYSTSEQPIKTSKAATRRDDPTLCSGRRHRICAQGRRSAGLRVSFTRITDHLGFKITRTVAQGIEEVAQLVRSSVIGNFGDRRYRN